MKIKTYKTNIYWTDTLQGLINYALPELVKIIKVTLIAALIFIPFIYLTIRALKISDQNYCAKYPKADYCKINLGK